MKKVLLLMLALAFGFGLKAQCPLTTAVDFTATDCHGTEVHLFDILDGGQYVLIDFFFTTCGPCQQATPKIVESYYALGCNMYDVFYMEISVSDANAACQNWAANYGVEYPTIATTGGGNGICNQYGIAQYPTVILIAPDRSIVIQDLWPINNAQTVINALGNYGIQQHDCTAPTPDPEVTIVVDQVTETEVTANFKPNEYCATYYYTIATNEEMHQWTAAAGMEIPEYLQNYGFSGEYEISHTFTDLTPSTEYTIYAVPADSQNNLGEVVQETVTTEGGGIIEIISDFSGTDLEGNAINLYRILDTGQAVLINFFLVDDPLSMTPMPFITESYELFGCNENDVYFMGICSNGHDDQCQAWAEEQGVKYPIISRDGGGNDIAQGIPVAMYPTVMIVNPDYTIAVRDLYPLVNTQSIVTALEEAGYEQHECTSTSVDESNATLSLFPNPANESVTLKGENLGTVRVFNAFGQQTDEFEANGTELNIPTARYANGIYFIKANETTLRFVIAH